MQNFTLETILKHIEIDCQRLRLSDPVSTGWYNPRNLTPAQTAIKRAYLKQMPDEQKALAIAKKYVEKKRLKFQVEYGRPELGLPPLDLAGVFEKVENGSMKKPQQGKHAEIINVPNEYWIEVAISNGAAKLYKTITLTAKKQNGCWQWILRSDIGENAKIRAEFERQEQQYIIVQVAKPEQAITMAKDLYSRKGTQSVVVRRSKPVHTFANLAMGLSPGFDKDGKPLYERVKEEEQSRRKLLTNNLPLGAMPFM